MSVPRYSSRIFVVDAEDRIYRLAGTRFSAMLKRPDAVPLRRFARQRIRCAEAIVDARARFVAAGAKWRPAHKLVRMICDAALEKTACPRL